MISSFPFPGTEPRGLSWDGTYLYAIDGPSKTLYKLDTAGNTIDTASIAVLGNDPEGLGFDGQYFWVTENQNDKIYQIDAGMVPNPAPDVKVNGQDGPLNLPQGDNLQVTVALAPGNQAGNNADWWVLVSSPFGWFRYNVVAGSWAAGFGVTYQGPLFTLNPYTVFNGPGLPVGGYTFYFGVDMNMNGSLDIGQAYYDFAQVTVQ